MSMKHWVETHQVLDRWAAALGSGKRAALCTVVEVKGSAYRREGAKLLVLEDGGSAGNVSGGCLEQDVREVGLRVIRSGVPELHSYCSSSVVNPPWDLGLGCDGRINVMVAPAPEPPLVERGLLQKRIPFAIATATQTGRRLVVTARGFDGTLGRVDLDLDVATVARRVLASQHSATETFGDDAVFIESLIPPPQIVLFGAGEDARPVARFASEVGFRIVLVDRRVAYLRPDLFPPGARLLSSSQADFETGLELDETCYAVVMTHNFNDDLAFVRRLLASPVPYIGVLGPRRRTERMLEQLTHGADFDHTDRSRIYGPVGLDIGAEGAEQVAISIVAEVLAVRSSLVPRPLRERLIPIHAAAV